MLIFLLKKGQGWWAVHLGPLFFLLRLVDMALRAAQHIHVNLQFVKIQGLRVEQRREVLPLRHGGVVAA